MVCQHQTGLIIVIFAEINLPVDKKKDKDKGSKSDKKLKKKCCEKYKKGKRCKNCPLG
jgi:hypothetical protein